MTIKHKIILAFVLLILISGSFPGISGQSPPRNATGYTRYIEVFQGDVPDTPDIESPSLLTVRDAMIYVIPWNVSRVYIHIPQGAEVNNFYDVHSNIANSAPSSYQDWYYWEFPEETNRDYTTVTVHNSSAFFNEGAYNTTYVNTSNDEVKLQTGVNASDYTSPVITVAEGVNVSSARLSLSTTYPNNISMQLSNNNGTNWESCTNNTFVDFATQGTDIKYKLNISGNSTVRPVIDNITLEYNYTPASTSLALMAEYTFTSDRDPPEFSMTKELLYGINPAQVIVYTDFDYNGDVLTGSGNIDWLGHWNTTDYEREGKSLAGVGTVEPGGTFTLSLQTADVDSSIDPVTIVYVITIILVIVGIFFIYKGYKDRGKKPADDEEPEAEESKNGEEDEGTEDESQTDEDSRDALLERKEKTLMAIKRLDTDFEEGVLSEDVYLELKEKYKSEAIRIMKKLDEG